MGPLIGKLMIDTLVNFNIDFDISTVFNLGQNDHLLKEIRENRNILMSVETQIQNIGKILVNIEGQLTNVSSRLDEIPKELATVLVEHDLQSYQTQLSAFKTAIATLADFDPGIFYQNEVALHYVLERGGARHLPLAIDFYLLLITYLKIGVEKGKDLNIQGFTEHIKRGFEGKVRALEFDLAEKVTLVKSTSTLLSQKLGNTRYFQGIDPQELEVRAFAPPPPQQKQTCWSIPMVTHGCTMVDNPEYPVFIRNRDAALAEVQSLRKQVWKAVDSATLLKGVRQLVHQKVFLA